MMSQEVFNAIESGDLNALEQILESGASSVVANEAGIHPLTLVASLIKKSYGSGNFEEEERYKRMAAMLIAHGAPDEDLEHACGEVSNLARHICRYVVDLSLEKRDVRRVSELIAMNRLWFEEESKTLEAAFLDAVAQGDRERINAMFENEQVHYAFEQ
jgi:hypothetical protein